MSSKVSPSSNEKDLENENIQLVQLKDIQPSPVIGNHDTSKFEVGAMEFVIDNEESSLDNIVYIDAEGVKCEESNEDEESSVGNIVYIDAEDIKCEESNEVIIWDTSNDAIDSSDAKPDNTRVNTHPQDSWPTLEILPGGIIKNADTLEPNMHLCDDIIFDSCELLYACAKCPMKFKNMFYLVKHIKWHEVEKKIQFAVQNESSLKTGNKGKLKKQATKKNKKS